MPILLNCSSRPREDVDAEPHHFTAEGQTSAEAYGAAQASLPEGWLLLHVRTD